MVKHFLGGWGSALDFAVLTSVSLNSAMSHVRAKMTSKGPAPVTVRQTYAGQTKTVLYLTGRESKIVFDRYLKEN